jgi:hypothetical protein
LDLCFWYDLLDHGLDLRRLVLVDRYELRWTIHLQTFLSVIWRSLINAIPGALGGLLVALVYNAVAGMMGGIKINLE